MRFKDLQIGQKLTVYAQTTKNVYEAKNAIVAEIIPNKISFDFLNENGKRGNGITLVVHSKHFWDLSASLNGSLKLEAPKND